jgi:chromosome segregation ATPase
VKFYLTYRLLNSKVDDYRMTIDELDARISDITSFVEMLENKNLALSSENETLRMKLHDMELKFDSFKQNEIILENSIQELKAYHFDKERHDLGRKDEAFQEKERVLILQFETREAELLAQLDQLAAQNKEYEADLYEVNLFYN